MRSVLEGILEGPNKFIIFGEWCTFQHSVPYGSLPDWFLVFDIYDLRESKFLSRRRIEQKLNGKMKLVPVLAKQRFGSLDEIKVLLDRPAAFRDDGGPLEGVYLRIESADWVVHRVTKFKMNCCVDETSRVANFIT